MTLKLKINPYDTLFIVKFQIFFLSKTRLFVSYQSFDIGFQTQMKTNWFKSLKRTTIQDSYLTQESCDQMTNDSPLVYQGQCTDENKDKHLIKKCYFFHLLQQKNHFFFTKNNYCDDKPLGTYFTESCIVLQTYSKEFTTTGSFVGSSWYLSR